MTKKELKKLVKIANNKKGKYTTEQRLQAEIILVDYITHTEQETAQEPVQVEIDLLATLYSVIAGNMIALDDGREATLSIDELLKLGKLGEMLNEQSNNDA